jgi:aminopeptidase-like protein
MATSNASSPPWPTSPAVADDSPKRLGDLGLEMHAWARDLWPMRRSLTGDGVRQTLAYLAGVVPGLVSHEVPSGTRAFDWVVPDEWTLREAFVADAAGARLVDVDRNILHVVGYSRPVHAVLTREQLEPHLHSLPEMPSAIPYVTSYYAHGWGFCLSHDQRRALGPGPFYVRIDSALRSGSLTYADVVIPGRETHEVLLTSYVCHPGMANNELSGPVVLAALARWLAGRADRRFTYRIVLAPETIGAIVYLSRHLRSLRERVVAGYVLTCVGDERRWSLLASPRGDTLADRAARHVLNGRGVAFDSYDFLQRGSDERQYCSPQVDLPVCSVMRSKYGTFPEYHTSLDDLTLVTPRGLAESFDVYREIIELLEANDTFVATSPCEPQLGRRGLYPKVGTRDSSLEVSAIADFLAFADGSRDLIALAERIGRRAIDCARVAERLVAEGLVVPAGGTSFPTDVQGGPRPT